MAKTIQVFSRPNCVQCTAVKRWLGDEKRQIPYTEVEGTDDTREFLYALDKYMQAPVTVVWEGEPYEGEPLLHFGGYNPGKLDELAELVA